MNIPSRSRLAANIIGKAKSLGASVAGVARVEDVKNSPSHLIFPKMGMNLDVHWSDRKADTGSWNVEWPKDAVSVVVIGVEHDAGQPELDWWDGKGTPGNRILIRINKQLSSWLEDTFTCTTYKLPYLIEKGGIFLKDAAVMAGLGCVGTNNMVITPEYGPRIRFRALLLNREVEPAGPLDFFPCQNCGQPCRTACPVKAFDRTVYSAHEMGQSMLPGTDGTYDRVTCNRKMDHDIADAVAAMHTDDAGRQKIQQSINEFEEGGPKPSTDENETSYCVKYCRECELICPVGR